MKCFFFFMIGPRFRGKILAKTFYPDSTIFGGNHQFVVSKLIFNTKYLSGTRYKSLGEMSRIQVAVLMSHSIQGHLKG